jgi:hypothetical protein
MAKAKSSGRASEKLVLNSKKNHGRHAKSRSKNKSSSTYEKPYAGQGR